MGGLPEDQSISIIVDGALSLRNGKRAWQCFQAGCEFVTLPRHEGHLGIICAFYVSDGLLVMALGGDATRLGIVFIIRNTG